MATNDLSNDFDRRIERLVHSKFQRPLVDVMDTFDSVCVGLECFVPGKWSASDAVRLTELVIARVPK